MRFGGGYGIIIVSHKLHIVFLTLAEGMCSYISVKSILHLNIPSVREAEVRMVTCGALHFLCVVPFGLRTFCYRKEGRKGKMRKMVCLLLVMCCLIPSVSLCAYAETTLPSFFTNSIDEYKDILNIRSDKGWTDSGYYRAFLSYLLFKDTKLNSFYSYEYYYKDYQLIGLLRRKEDAKYTVIATDSTNILFIEYNPEFKRVTVTSYDSTLPLQLELRVSDSWDLSESDLQRVLAFLGETEEKEDYYISGDYRYVLLEDGTVKIVKYIGRASGNRIDLPEKLDNKTVSAIGKETFVDVGNYCSFSIPNCITTIESNPFADATFNCAGSIYLAPDHPTLVMIDHVLFSKPDKRLINHSPHYGKQYDIPDGIRVIEDAAFSHCGDLRTINIPDSVTTIGKNAFSGCNRLDDITIPNSVTTIGEEAFSNCDNLKNITFPDGVTSIGGVGYCKNLNKITIPSSVTSIGKRAFAGCVGLTTITIPDGVTSIGDKAFYGCDGLTTITIPDGVTSIGKSAFEKCKNLTTVTIPNSVTEIGIEAFEDCENLTTITIPNCVTSIGNNTYYKCKKLTSITLPDNVMFIGDSAFYGCKNLTAITIPNGVKAIGASAFYDCDSLTDITIPDSVKYIGNEAFCDCDSLTDITIPDSVKYIGNEAFYGCDRLTSITLPNSVTTIGKDAFYRYKGQDLVLTVEKNTYAEKYCFDNGLNYIFPDTVISYDWLKD